MKTLIFNLNHRCGGFFRRILITLALLAVAAPALPAEDAGARNEEITAQFFARISERAQPNVAMLNLFLTAMPKGGDLHHHYSGTIYVETYLKWVKEKGWWIDKNTLRILTDKDAPGGAPITVDELIADNLLYRKLMTLWSDRDYDNHYHDQPPPDVNFFNTFFYFGQISGENIDQGLNIIKRRAIDENVAYIETQLKRTGLRATNFFDDSELARYNDALRAAASQPAVNALLDDITAALQSDPAFAAGIRAYVNRVADYHRGIDDDQFTMRYQTYAVRVQSPMQVFAELYSGYLAADSSDLIVGVNIVAPEHNHVALADYTLHMRMYRYLLEKYPDVGRSLHSGELTLGMVRPEDLLFHMRQAREIAQAQRIGHGIDLPYEKDALSLLEDLKNNAVIEINLTSNEFILGVEGEGHPYRIYEQYGVPMVICTDDSGVSRNNLTNEYLRLATRYQPDYATVKKYVYNSIRYAFLEEPRRQKVIAQLDRSFQDFEQQMATLYQTRLLPK